jgi:putative oxidoreductase
MNDFGLLILRFAGLGLALAHGLGKLMNLASGNTGFIESLGRMGLPMPAVFAWAAALSEVVGGLLVFLGLGTRVAAAFCAITMAVAAIGRHHAHDLLLVKMGLLKVPAENLQAWGNPELALMYLVPFVALVLLGGGQFSLERMFKKGSRR